MILILPLPHSLTPSLSVCLFLFASVCVCLSLSLTLSLSRSLSLPPPSLAFSIQSDVTDADFWSTPLLLGPEGVAKNLGEQKSIVTFVRGMIFGQ